MEKDSSLGAPSGVELRRMLEWLRKVLRAVLEGMVFTDEQACSVLLPLTYDHVNAMEASNRDLLLQLLDRLSFQRPSPQETFWKFPGTWTAADLMKRIDFINEALEGNLPNMDKDKLKDVLQLSEEEMKSLDIWNDYGRGTGTQESGERAGPSGESQAGPSSCGTSSDLPVEERKPEEGKLKRKRPIIESDSDEDNTSSTKKKCTKGEIDNGSKFEVEKSCDGNENHNSDISRMDKESNLPSSQESEDIIESSQESRPLFSFNSFSWRTRSQTSMGRPSTSSSAQRSTIASTQEDSQENSSVDVLPLNPSPSKIPNLLRSNSANSIPETVASSQESCTSEITSRKTIPDGDDVIVPASDYSSDSDIFRED